jgi:hypothetical protein
MRSLSQSLRAAAHWQQTQPRRHPSSHAYGCQANHWLPIAWMIWQKRALRSKRRP